MYDKQPSKFITFGNVEKNDVSPNKYVYADHFSLRGFKCADCIGCRALKIFKIMCP